MNLSNSKSTAKKIARTMSDETIPVLLMTSESNRLTRLVLLITGKASHVEDELAEEFVALVLACGAVRLFDRTSEIENFINDADSLESPALEYAKSYILELVHKELASRRRKITIK